jgi:hypothetical protein
MNEPKKAEERRRYVRLNSVFPVQFRVLSLDGKHFLSGWLQGFTRDISKGGICLNVNNLNSELADLLKNQKVKLSLEIEMYLTRSPIPALAMVSWVEEVVNEANKYSFGLNYEEIDQAQNKHIMRYVWTKRVFAPLIATVITLLLLAFAADSIINIKLARGNRELVNQLIRILQESSVAKQKIKETAKERGELQLKIQSLEQKLQALAEERDSKEELRGSEIRQLNELTRRLGQEKDVLEEQLISVQHKESSITEELLRLDKKKATLEKANLDKMYHWLKVHQNTQTGLIMSFEGDGDAEGLGFTYDQALSVIAFSYYSDFARAKKILEFYQNKAKRVDGRFLNGYYALDGNPAEYTVHSGPNIWLGIAIMHYSLESQDMRFVPLAAEIAGATMHLQDQDVESGIRGGPDVEWYSTEHNLDAYAFFNMLYKITGKPQYSNARDKVLAWLVRHTYSKTDVPVKRGKGDSTIATDTYAWSIAAIGPEKLEELGMDPGGIMEFAEKNCAVEVTYRRPEGNDIKVRGFDFAPQRNIARGGVVSSEWTAQMIVSFKLLADFYYKKGMVAKARSYELKADSYLAELGNMVISSSSPSGQGEGCLPYATEGQVDTGHGWLTPGGNNTGSVAGTIYTIFAYYKYNPLELRED